MSADAPLFARRGVRWLLIGLVGLYLFTLCAAYIAREPIAAEVSFVVLGPEVVEPSGAFPLRVLAYRHQPREHLLTTILAAAIEEGGRVRSVDIKEGRRGTPALIHIGPAPRSAGTFTVRLTVETDGERKELAVPLVVYHPHPNVQPRPLGLPDEVPPDNELNVEILPEGAGLALGMRNRVWVRVTDPAGAPVPAATVAWSTAGATVPGDGAVETDEAGVATLDLEPRNLMVKFTVVAEKGGLTGKLNESHRPMGRSVIIDLDRVLQAPGEPPIPISVRRSDSVEPTWCDLYRGDAWLRTWSLQPPEGGAEVVQIVVDLPSPDTYRLQCYAHFADPGDGPDAVWLFRTGEPRIRAMSAMLRDLSSSPSRSVRTRRYRKRVPVIDDGGRRAMLSGYRSRAVEVTVPALVMSTREDDVAAADLANSSVQVRFFIMIGLSFGLVILWAIYTAVQTSIDNRRRLAEAISELGELAVDVEPPTRLVRLRRSVQMAFVIIVLVLNVIAMLELFQYM